MPNQTTRENKAPAWVGSSPAQASGAGSGASPAHYDVVFGTYKCIECGETMLSLTVTDESGRVIYREEPLLCPDCATRNDVVWAIRTLMDKARSPNELITLLQKLMSMVIKERSRGAHARGW